MGSLDAAILVNPSVRMNQSLTRNYFSQKIRCQTYPHFIKNVGAKNSYNFAWDDLHGEKATAIPGKRGKLEERD